MEPYPLNQRLVSIDNGTTTVDLLAVNKSLRDEITALRANLHYTEDERDEAMARCRRYRLRYDGYHAHRQIDYALMWFCGLAMGVVMGWLIWSARGLLHT